MNDSKIYIGCCGAYCKTCKPFITKLCSPTENIHFLYKFYLRLTYYGRSNTPAAFLEFQDRSEKFIDHQNQTLYSIKYFKKS